MSVKDNFSKWLDSMKAWIENPKGTHPPQPGTAVVQVPAPQVVAPQITTPNQEQGVTGVNISPDFENPTGADKYPTKLEGSVLTITTSRLCDFITGEVWTCNPDGTLKQLVIVGQAPFRLPDGTLPQADKLLLKLERVDQSLKGLCFLRVRSAPPADGSYGLETNFIIK